MNKLIIFLFLTTKLFSQNITDVHQKQITVTGRAQIALEPTSYIVEINLKENYISKDPPEIILAIDSIELNLRKFIEAMKLDSKKLNLISVATINSSFKGQDITLHNEVFEYKLKSYDELKNFVTNIKFAGLTAIRVRKLFEIDKTAIESQLYVDALKNAKGKAEAILASVNKKLGEIISIDSYDYHYNLPNFDDEFKSNWDTYLIDLNKTKIVTAMVNVAYEIK